MKTRFAQLQNISNAVSSRFGHILKPCHPLKSHKKSLKGSATKTFCIPFHPKICHTKHLEPWNPNINTSVWSYSPTATITNFADQTGSLPTAKAHHVEASPTARSPLSNKTNAVLISKVHTYDQVRKNLPKRKVSPTG